MKKSSEDCAIFALTLVAVGLGCFDLDKPDEYKLAHSGVLPDSPADVGVLYEVITSSNPGGNRFPYTAEPRSMGFVTADPLVVVVHGLGSSIDKTYYREIPNAMVAKVKVSSSE